jgi:hypothetical protein
MTADERGSKTKHLYSSNPRSSVFIRGHEVFSSNLLRGDLGLDDGHADGLHSLHQPGERVFVAI